MFCLLPGETSWRRETEKIKEKSQLPASCWLRPSLLLLLGLGFVFPFSCQGWRGEKIKGQEGLAEEVNIRCFGILEMKRCQLFVRYSLRKSEEKFAPVLVTCHYAVMVMPFRKKLVILQYNLTRYLALENIPFRRISVRSVLWQNKMVEEIPASNFKTVSSELAFRSWPHTRPVLCLALLQFYVVARKHSTFQNFTWLLLNKHIKSAKHLSSETSPNL